MKTNTEAAESEYKNYKNLFEKIRKKSKKSYYSSLIKKYENNPKKTWLIMKEITGKKKCKTGILPKMIRIENQNIYEE